MGWQDVSHHFLPPTTVHRGDLVAASRREQPLEHLGVQRPLAQWRGRAFDRQTSQFVSKGHRRLLHRQHATTQAFLQSQRGHFQDRLQQPALNSGGND